ncbi:MAG: hypothetical protein JWO62_3716 [Acidimicrobiaceae bacterium]|nr:hypothetical protein [Acidimicrobiaceae bacterium]
MRRALAGVLDLIGILVFVGIGRSVHTDGVTLAGMASTAWPFLTGAAIGWIAVRAWRRPMAILPSGVAVWLACVAIAMVLRVVSGQGTAVGFVAVALAFLGAVMVGWRAAAQVGAALRARSGYGAARRPAAATHVDARIR